MLHFEGSTLYAAFKAVYIPKFKLKKEPTDDVLEDARNAIKDLIALKGDNKFLAGNDASIADISLAMSYTFSKYLFEEEFKPLEQWYKNVEIAIPAVKEINDAVDFSPIADLLKK